MNESEFELLNFDVFPNPSTDLIAVQANGLVKSPIAVDLFSSNGTLVKQTMIHPGQTIAYFDVQALHQGTYLVKISNGSIQKAFKIVH
jgi:hypothetical protein